MAGTFSSWSSRPARTCRRESIAGQFPSTRRGGHAVAWSRTKPELYYARGPEIVAITYGLDSGRFRIERERIWASVPGAEPAGVFEAGPDGRILIDLPAEPPLPQQLRVIFNWGEELERLIGGRR